MPLDLRNRCPMCGYEFEPDEIKDEIKCPRCKEACKKEELIGEWDDCAYDY